MHAFTHCLCKKKKNACKKGRTNLIYLIWLRSFLRMGRRETDEPFAQIINIRRFMAPPCYITPALASSPSIAHPLWITHKIFITNKRHSFRRSNPINSDMPADFFLLFYTLCVCLIWVTFFRFVSTFGWWWWMSQYCWLSVYLFLSFFVFFFPVTVSLIIYAFSLSFGSKDCWGKCEAMPLHLYRTHNDRNGEFTSYYRFE